MNCPKCGSSEFQLTVTHTTENYLVIRNGRVEPCGSDICDPVCEPQAECQGCGTMVRVPSAIEQAACEMAGDMADV